jgi:hypothetical protein
MVVLISIDNLILHSIILGRFGGQNQQAGCDQQDIKYFGHRRFLLRRLRLYTKGFDQLSRPHQWQKSSTEYGPQHES